MGTATASYSADQVREQLARILASSVFASSRRMCRFLSFVVDRTLESDVDRLKEFTVAMEVFDRDDKYDPNIDSIVRVEARRLRAKLKSYYDGPGAQDRLLIDLRPGSYVAEFGGREPDITPVSGQPQVHAEAQSERSVAVLPFVNMSSDPEQEYFCDGITEEIINALTTIEDLNIVARTSAFQFKGRAVDIREIGERLGARVLIEGSVRKAGNRLRITAQAIDSARGYHLWSETFNRDMDDVFAVQMEISSAIAGILNVRLRPSPSVATRNVNAFNGYLKGRFLEQQLSPESLPAALAQYRSVIGQHPDYPEPRVALAVALGYTALFGAVPGRAVQEEMRQQLDVALRLDPESPVALAGAASITCLMDYEWERGEEMFRKALQLQPGHADARAWYAMVRAHLGRFEEAVADLLLVSRLDPLSPTDCTRLACVYHLMDQPENAKLQLDNAFALLPGYHHARVFQALVMLQEENYEIAGDTLANGWTPPPMLMGLLAAVYFRWGKPNEADQWLRRLNDAASQRYVSPLAFAFEAIGRGNADDALAAIDRAITDKHAFTAFLGVAPIFDPLRKHPRFQGLLDRLRLPAVR